MERFARIVMGYHGAKAGGGADFLRKLLVEEANVEDWMFSRNNHDWLGHGIYFWEHSPERAWRWAGPDGTVIGAVIQLGSCLDLTDLQHTKYLQKSYFSLETLSKETGVPLPKNSGRDLANRKLDCLVINNLTSEVLQRIQTVRGAFEEGAEAFPGSALKAETHIQIAVRDIRCILGLFLPTFYKGEN